MTDQDNVQESVASESESAPQTLAQKLSAKAAALTPDKAEEALGSIAATLHLDELKEKVAPATTKVKEGADKLADTVGEKLGDVPEKADKWMDEAKDKAGDLVGDAKEMATSTWHKLVSTIKH